jgi:transposase
MEQGYKVVGVNPFHTKKAKELDDNSPTKSDKKDALTIARLVRDGRYFEPYLPSEEYGELRALSNTRVSIFKRASAVKNTITAILDEYVLGIIRYRSCVSSKFLWRNRRPDEVQKRTIDCQLCGFQSR